ncbi:MAG: hypothetical protein HOV80_25755 [Polyangiaceae bacterium]|nr:hypothetical protein [Polyangiaceae bacterium]
MSKPLFTCGYANFAWGRVARGTVLDDKGRLWTYDLGTTWSGTPVPDGAEGLYLESGLRERFKKLVLQKTRVPLEQLATMQKKAESAREGRIEKRQVAHDAGGSGCDAYLWERPDAYREVELGTDGVYEVRNLSPEADEIWVWLEMDLGMR